MCKPESLTQVEPDLYWNFMASLSIITVFQQVIHHQASPAPRFPSSQLHQLFRLRRMRVFRSRTALIHCKLDSAEKRTLDKRLQINAVQEYDLTILIEALAALSGIPSRRKVVFIIEVLLSRHQRPPCLVDLVKTVPHTRES